MENFSRFRTLDDTGVPAQIPRRTPSDTVASAHRPSPRRVVRRVACNMKAEWLYLKQIYDFPAMLLANLLQMHDGWRAPAKAPTLTPSTAVVEDL
jgi:hypothetical protein